MSKFNDPFNTKLSSSKPDNYTINKLKLFNDLGTKLRNLLTDQHS